MDPPVNDQNLGASRRNMLLLIQLRWIAICGQLATIWAVASLMHIALPLPQLLTAPLLLLLINVLSLMMVRGRRGFTNGELFVELMLDVLALGWQLYHSGGATNPFAFLFLLQIVIGAVILQPRWSLIIGFVASIAMLFLTFNFIPLALPPAYASDPFGLYLHGSLACFVLIAALLMVFVVRLDRNRRESDAALAALRQQAAEEDHIIRMGLLASGAAHELGTPLSSMSVILGDWARQPDIAEDADLTADIAEMQAELQRCKQIVSGILMSAGEVRGENPAVTTMRAFLRQIIGEWRPRVPGELHFLDSFGEDVSIVSDPALKQVIGNIIDNAIEVSPHRVTLSATREGDDLILEIRDGGPGFPPRMLESFGRPYSSTKGRAGGGLGLFLVVNVMRKLGGKVEAANLPGGGASVRLIIPLASLAYAPES